MGITTCFESQLSPLFGIGLLEFDAVGLGRDRTDKLLVKQEQSPMMEEAAEGEQDPMLGGMASGQDITQSIRSVANRTRPQSASRR